MFDDEKICEIKNISEIGGFYINLDYRVDRKIHMEEQLKNTGLQNSVQRFSAIKHANGRIGCSMSHLKCLKMAKERNMEYVLIIEDDILFLLPDTFIKNINKFFYTNKYWDVLLLAGNNLPPFRNHDKVSIQVSHCQTTTGYIVKKHYFDTLISNIKESILFLMKAPEHHFYYAIDKHWITLQKQHRWMLLIPLTVVQRPDYSDIEQKNTDYKLLMTSLDKSEFKK